MKSQLADRSVSLPMTLNDLKRRDANGNTFPVYLRKYAQTV